MRHGFIILVLWLRLFCMAYTDTVNQSDAKAEVCKAVLVEMLLRAPRRGCVRLLPHPLQRIPDDDGGAGNLGLGAPVAARDARLRDGAAAQGG